MDISYLQKLSNSLLIQSGRYRNVTSGTVYAIDYPISFETMSCSTVATSTQAVAGVATLYCTTTTFKFATNSTTQDNFDWLAAGF